MQQFGQMLLTAKDRMDAERQKTEHADLQGYRSATLAQGDTTEARQQAEFEHKQAMDAKPKVGESGFTLSPGETRYDSAGKPIASIAPRSTATGQGVGRGVTSGDANRLADYKTSVDDLNTLEAVIGSTGTLSKIQSWMPQWVNEMTGGWGDDAKSRNAVIARVKQVIGKALEGGVLRKEDEEKYKDILPTIYDSKTVAKSKINGLRTAIHQRRDTLLDSLEDSGYNTAKFRARAEGSPDSTSSSGPKPTMRYNPATGKTEPIQ
jgi:hypothetical protein